MSFLDLIRGEILPSPPMVEDPDIDKFNRDIIDYLRRFAGRFTDENLGISQEGTFFDFDDTVNSHTGNTTKTVLKTVAVPGTTITSGRSLKVEAFGHVSSGAPSTFDLHLDYGSTTLTESLSMDISAAGNSWYLTAYIQWLTNTSQRAFALWGENNFNATTGTGTENTTADLDLKLAVTIDSGSTADTIACDIFLVKSIGDALALPRGR